MEGREMNEKAQSKIDWVNGKLGDPRVASVVMGQSPPGSTYNSKGEGLPFFQGKADFGRMHPTPHFWCTAPKKIAEPGDILLSVRAPVGPTNIAREQCCIGRGLAAIHGEKKALTQFIYYWFKHIGEWLGRQGEGSTFKAIGKDRVNSLTIPIPPLPVQERIVQILQKSVEICHKRQEALELANAILPSIFHHTFECNGSAWPKKRIGEIVKTRSGGTPSRRKSQYWSGPIPWVSPSDMKVTEIYDSEEHISEKAIDESATNLIEPNTILVVVRSGILAHTFPVAITRTSVAFNQDIRALLPNQELLIPEYLLWALKARAPHVLMSIVKRGSTVHSIDSSRFFDMTIPVPPIAVQRTFVNQVEQLVAASQRLYVGVSDSESLFNSLLARAFTGELTIEWETVNADWIKAQIDLQDRLPRLLILALVRERASRATKAAKATILVTALMKYAFLFQMEGNGRRRFYQFVPYHFGPFAKEIYDDLERLKAEGLVVLENDADADKTRIALADPTRTEAALAELPDDLKEDVITILDTYGDLDHNALLKTVYEKYPAYAKNSRIRIGARATSTRKSFGKKQKK
jgi:type I restriction enzyme S subunit